MSDRIQVMKYLGEFDFYFKDEKIGSPSSESVARFNAVILESDVLLEDLITRGIQDGSVKKDINIPLMVTTISQVLWSFGQRIAIRGEMIIEESGFSGIDLMKNQVSLYVAALRKE
ncbi:MAG: hypothetical protein PF518_16820 [Spirochaetaceae bacterium]|jgi:hypothetical protein|nr:hypothetical protein [Spirochaetaceae bacterium]